MLYFVHPRVSPQILLHLIAQLRVNILQHHTYQVANHELPADRLPGFTRDMILDMSLSLLITNHRYRTVHIPKWPGSKRG